jgi:hypothetical protein
MGLAFSDCDAGWSYTGFMRFRLRLAAQLGHTGYIKAMNAPFGSTDTKYKILGHPLDDFFDHSDCDGHLTPGQCAVIAPALADAIKDWPDDDYDKQTALELIKGMEYAINKNKNLEFR